MCGICGAYRPSGGCRATDSVIGAMRNAMRHRGPDDEGSFRDDRAALGFRRLSIVDLETGNQPIPNEDQSIWVVCNGEIFNHQAVRAELEARGHVFTTRTDVEVLVHLYEEAGDKLLDRLNGQFAFAIYDTRRNRLFCARDHFGIAPFFYTDIDGEFVFASEIKAILAYPGRSWQVDLTGLDQVLSLPGLVSPRTMFEDIQSLPAGHFIVVDENGTEIAPYWDADYPREEATRNMTPEEACAALDMALGAAVRRRLQGDVPVGAYLSGGLDSSLIASLMARTVADPIGTFSVTFGDRMYDEDGFQDQVSDQIGSRHYRIAHQWADIEGDLRRSIWHSECPVKETYNTASMALSGAARACGVPVVLSGEGADELFAGYIGYRYDAFRRMSGFGTVPCRAEQAMRHYVLGHPTFLYEKDLLSHEAERRGLYSEEVRAKMDGFKFTNWPLVDGEKLEGRHPIHQRSYLDLKLRLADHLVGDHGDRMLMANSVEGRFPFLDVELFEVIRSLPPDLLLNDYVEKYILKETARPYLPPAIIEREKFAFSAPGSAYLLRAKIPWVEEMLSPDIIRAQGYFDVAAVERLKQRALAEEERPTGGAPDDPLLTVLSFGVFLDVFKMPWLGQREAV